MKRPRGKTMDFVALHMGSLSKKGRMQHHCSVPNEVVLSLLYPPNLDSPLSPPACDLVMLLLRPAQGYSPAHHSVAEPKEIVNF